MHHHPSSHHTTWALEAVSEADGDIKKSKNHQHHAILFHLRHVFARLFLPLGYPHSVAPGYMAYQVYDSIQALSSYLRGVVCTSAVLQASGVGQAEANALSAAMQWATRDGVGMVGGLVFSYQCGDVLDLYVQEFRLLADLSNDVALTLDLMAPLLLSFYSNSNHNTAHLLLILLSASTIGKTICGIAAGATKGRITQYFAVQGNMADLTAKESTQETFVSLCGMMGGLGMAQMLQQSFVGQQEKDHHVVVLGTTWILFGILTLIHVWANYRAVALLQFPTLNPTRARACILPVLKAIMRRKDNDNDKSKRDVAALCQQHLLGPHEIPCCIWTTLFRLLTTGNGNPDGILVDAAKRDDMNLADWMPLSQSQSRCYAIGWSHNKSIRIVLLQGATHRTELQAYVHALWLSSYVYHYPNLNREEVLKRSFEIINDDFMDALWQALLDKGWELEPRLYLGFSEQRYRIIEVAEGSSKKEN